jgi:hypothetical protein
MSIELPGALAREVAEIGVDAKPATSQRVDTAIAVVFAASVVLFVSFIAVMTGLA